MEESCAVRLLHPFVSFVSTRDEISHLAPAILSTLDPDSRLPLRICQENLERASELIKHPTLGLDLGLAMAFGGGGVFDFVVRSAATVRDSIRVAARYSRLIASPFIVSLETKERSSIIRFDDEVPWSRDVADFTVAAWYRAHAAEELPRGAHPECWFPYPAGPNLEAYERAFPGSVLRFDAPFLGFVFDRRYEDAPMPVADPMLHTLLCARAEALLNEVSEKASTRRAIRLLIGQDIRDGNTPTVETMARRLHMSHRTVSRRLEQEGTTFAAELDGARRELAIALVRQSDLPLVDIAFRVGFSHAESFFRAFRRWTGATPQAYRTSERATG
jgi:AraC-like DNA-binding protein